MNKLVNHTPGPWAVRFFPGDNTMFFVEAKNNNKPALRYGIEILQEDYGDHNGYPGVQRLADAFLISAAPEMLEMLMHLEKILPEEGYPETAAAIGRILNKALNR